MLESINKLLAQLFANFKLEKPVVAAVILIILGTGNHFLQELTVSGIEGLPMWVPKVLEVTSFILVALTGTSTFKYLNPPKKPED